MLTWASVSPAVGWTDFGLFILSLVIVLFGLRWYAQGMYEDGFEDGAEAMRLLKKMEERMNGGEDE